MKTVCKQQFPGTGRGLGGEQPLSGPWMLWDSDDWTTLDALQLTRKRTVCLNATPDAGSSSAHLSPLDFFPPFLLSLPLQFPLLLQLLLQLQLSFALLFLALPLFPLLLGALQLSQTLLLFALLLQEGLPALLQLQIATFKILPLLVLKCYFKTKETSIMKRIVTFKESLRSILSVSTQTQNCPRSL